MTTTKLKAARVTDGVVTGVILVPDKATATQFNAVLCPDRCAPGWGYDGVDFIEPAPRSPLEDVDAERFADLVKSACRARIISVANESAQLNMASAAALGTLSESDVAAYADGVTWIASMRATSADLIANHVLTALDDSSWPAAPAVFVALADRF
jgi:hypothetical protein